MAELLQDQNYLFNSRLETGMRSLVILEAAFPNAFDLTHLTWLDYLVVHTADIGGPASLHPKLIQNSGEPLVRRTLVYDGLTLMRQVHLIVREERVEGQYYRSTEHAQPALRLLREPYNVELSLRADWLVEWVGGHSEQDLRLIVQETVGQWGAEFGSAAERSEHYEQ